MQWFREYIRVLVRARNMQQSKETILDLITSRMTIDLHVFRSLVKDGVGGYVHCRFIVAEELSIRGDINLQASEKLLKP